MGEFFYFKRGNRETIAIVSLAKIDVEHTNHIRAGRKLFPNEIRKARLQFRKLSSAVAPAFYIADQDGGFRHQWEGVLSYYPIRKQLAGSTDERDGRSLRSHSQSVVPKGNPNKRQGDRGEHLVTRFHASETTEGFPNQVGGRGGRGIDIMHDRSHMTIDPRIPTKPGQRGLPTGSTSRRL